MKTRVETQYVARGIINRVEPEKPATLEISLPEIVAEAKLKIVQVGWDNETSVCEFNGHQLPLVVGESHLHDQVIDAKLLQPVNKLTFTTKPGAAKGFGIDMASIVLSR